MKNKSKSSAPFLYARISATILFVFVSCIVCVGKDTKRYLVTWPHKSAYPGQHFTNETSQSESLEVHSTIPGKEAHTNSASFIYLSTRGVVVSTNEGSSQLNLMIDRLEDGSPGVTNVLLRDGDFVKMKSVLGEWFFTVEKKSVPFGVQRALGKVLSSKQGKNRLQGIDESVGGFNVPRRPGESWRIKDVALKARFLEPLHDLGLDIPPKNLDIQCGFIGITNIFGVACFHVRFECSMKTDILPLFLRTSLTTWSRVKTIAHVTLDWSFPCDGTATLLSKVITEHQTTAKAKNSQGTGYYTSKLRRERSDFHQLQAGQP